MFNEAVRDTQHHNVLGRLRRPLTNNYCDRGHNGEVNIAEGNL